jgi:hypothetical protein
MQCNGSEAAVVIARLGEVSHGNIIIALDLISHQAKLSARKQAVVTRVRL